MTREEILDLSPKLPSRPAWQELSTPPTIQLTKEAPYPKNKKNTTQLSKRELKKQVNKIIKATKLGKKEKALLKLLSKKFETKTKKEISEETKSKAPVKLISSVRKKLNGSNFGIKTNMGNYDRKTTYELKHLPAQKSS